MASDWIKHGLVLRPAPLTASAWGLEQVNTGPTERIVSLAGAVLLGGLATRYEGWRRWALGAGGLVLAHRGVTGSCMLNAAIGRDSATPTHYETETGVSRTFLVERPRDEVYEAWRRLEALPRFLHHVAGVRAHRGGRGTWTAVLPDGEHVQWETEMVVDEPGARVAWRSLPGGDVEHAGEVRFADAPGGLGTLVRVELTYQPVANEEGEALEEGAVEGGAVEDGTVAGGEHAREVEAGLDEAIEDDLAHVYGTLRSLLTGRRVPTNGGGRPLVPRGQPSAAHPS